MLTYEFDVFTDISLQLNTGDQLSSYARRAQWCLTPWDPTDCSPPGSSVLGFSRQEYWRGLWCSPPEDLPDPGMAPPVFYVSFWQAGSLPLHHLGSPFSAQKYILNKPDLWNARLWSRYIRERFFWWGAFSHYERILKRLTVFPPQIEIDFLDCYGL